MRNLTSEKNPEIVRRLEHASFMTGIDAALERLTKTEQLSYSDMLETHRILFEAVYPWAGQDRLTTAPELAVANLIKQLPEELRTDPAVQMLEKEADDKVCNIVHHWSGRYTKVQYRAGQSADRMVEL